ncbi:DUF6906 family protein [Ruminiclostridium sufflavum]|uniref:DUF6906 family protein n=1 Tax=Ruminiclostridium sufflavum TaxID=396504 RepID=UPI000D7BEE3C|nr:hypothetical protein [Ruminiclostridium sufflavum]
MKHGKCPTRAQKIRLTDVGLNCKNWLVVKATTQCLEVVHRHTGNTRNIPTSLGKNNSSRR